MNIKIPRDILYPTLSRAQSILERKSTRPILENILIEISDSSMWISSTDLRISMKQQVSCEILRPGSVVIPGRKLHEIVREMPSTDILLEVKENGWLTVSSGKSIFHLPGISADEYPSLPTPPQQFLDIDASLFRSMLDKTLFAASNDESRMNLCGVFVRSMTDDSGNSQLRMVATDGHRLSLSEQDCTGDFSLFDEGVIIPKKGLAEIRTMIDSLDTTFKLATSDGRIFVQVENTNLSITLIDGNFPNYNQVIPKEIDKKLYVEKDSIINALKRVSLLSDQETHTVIIDGSPESVVLSSTSRQFGDAREELDTSYDGDALRAAFNSVYLLEAIRTLQGEQIGFSIGDPLAPCILRGSGDPRHLCVVMPMRID